MSVANPQNLIPFNKLTESRQREIAQNGGIASGEARREKAAMSAVWQKHFLDKISDNKLMTEKDGKIVPLKWDEFMTLCLKESPIRTAKEAREATEGSKSKVEVTGTVRFE